MSPALAAFALLVAGTAVLPACGACSCPAPPGTDFGPSTDAQMGGDAGLGADAAEIRVAGFEPAIVGLSDQHFPDCPTCDQNSSMAFFRGDLAATSVTVPYDPVTGDGCVVVSNDPMPGYGDYATWEVGDVLVQGTRLGDFVLTCVPSVLGGCRYTLQGDGPLFDLGAALGVSAPGGPFLGAFSLAAEAPDLPFIVDPPGTMDGDPVPIVRGEPLTLRWTPGQADEILVGQYTILCRSDDDGEITIPGELTADLETIETIPWRLWVWRRLSVETMSSDGQRIVLRVTRTTEVLLTDGS